MNEEEKVNAEKNSTPSFTIGGIPFHNITKDSFEIEKIRWSMPEINFFISNLPEYTALAQKFKDKEISKEEANIELKKIYAEYDDLFYSYY